MLRLQQIRPQRAMVVERVGVPSFRTVPGPLGIDLGDGSSASAGSHYDKETRRG